ncbi:unnamed protein product [Cyprideis torosa]|uniref:Nuclear cap-binding protein subunit 2 n=1 Tax=Cyprideis torosa TaxID=163714 RepID=A0A7R8ZI04_9CRUS|nr:unnamed protein product [Cyprideis torosa]CAG0884980.1 unnamed protein product [Cyprideis torosa]
MVDIYGRDFGISQYRDQHFKVYELFSQAGDVKRIVMGLDRFRKTPCGFCFVEYYTRSDAENALFYITGTRLDDRIIRCDFDAGFIEGRQYGRGKSGGQVRDEYRSDYDPGRGGFGKLVQQQRQMQQKTQGGGPGAGGISSGQAPSAAGGPRPHPLQR